MTGIGAWENQAGPGGPIVTIGMPHKEITHVQWAIGLSNLQKPPMTALSLSKGTPWDIARNTIVRDARANNSTHVFFLDTDVVPPPDALMKLIAHNQPVMSGLYYCRHRTDVDVSSLPVAVPPVPAMWQDNGAGAYAPIVSWVDPMVGCAVVGAGCLLVNMSVFDKLDKDLGRDGNYFKWTAGHEKNEEFCEHLPGVSEDFFFCRLVRQIGLQILVDTSIKCNHMAMATVINEKGIDFSSI
ncbi:MAG: hypothetical protein KAJ39_00420 [Gammaproteobacteria bacterium]|nr:hypothetical protein [Gammaproteobacteria bacterium]